MEKNSISIKVIFDKKTFTISNDSPNFDEVIKFVIENPDFELDKIKIECSEENFDDETFKAAMVESLVEIKDKVKIEKDKYDNLLKSIAE